MGPKKLKMLPNFHHVSLHDFYETSRACIGSYTLGQLLKFGPFVQEVPELLKV